MRILYLISPTFDSITDSVLLRQDLRLNGPDRNSMSLSVGAVLVKSAPSGYYLELTWICPPKLMHRGTLSLGFPHWTNSL